MRADHVLKALIDAGHVTVHAGDSRLTLTDDAYERGGYRRLRTARDMTDNWHRPRLAIASNAGRLWCVVRGNERT